MADPFKTLSDAMGSKPKPAPKSPPATAGATRAGQRFKDMRNDPEFKANVEAAQRAQAARLAAEAKKAPAKNHLTAPPKK